MNKDDLKSLLIESMNCIDGVRLKLDNETNAYHYLSIASGNISDVLFCLKEYQIIEKDSEKKEVPLGTVWKNPSEHKMPCMKGECSGVYLAVTNGWKCNICNDYFSKG